MKFRIKAPRLWSSWDDDQKASAIKITGCAFALFAIFTLLSCVSYIFTWKADASLLDDPAIGKVGHEVANMCGKSGLRWSHLLIAKCFGLGSFALMIILFAISARLIASRWHSSMLKTAVLTVAWTFESSLVLAYVGKLCDIPVILGAGLGGACGTLAESWIHSLLGDYITGGVLALLAVVLLVFTSKSFATWFANIGKGRGAREEFEEDAEETAEEETAAEDSETKEEEQELFPPETVQVPEETIPGPSTFVMSEPPAKQVVYDIPEESEIVSEQTPEVPEEPVAEIIQQPEEDPSLTAIEDGQVVETDIKKPLEPIDIRLDYAEGGLPKYQFPPLDILSDHGATWQDISNEELQRNNTAIRANLLNYGIKVDDVKAIVGPTVTLYKVYPAPGVRISSIKSRQEDIALSLNAKGVRITTLSDSVGIEVANDRPQIVPLRGLLNDESFRNSKAELPVAIGCNITRKVKVFDLADAPHLLVAGATKQGKSVGLNVLIASLLYAKHPAELKFVFIDPKMVEFSSYARLLKHHLAVLPDAVDGEDEMKNAIIKQPKEAEKVLRSLCKEMDDRYQLMSEAYVNNVKLYNEQYKARKLLPTKGHKFMPYIVVIVDEYADLTMSGGTGQEAKTQQRSITASIVRLAQKGRAAGIHVVLATQRPSVDVITGLIKTNFPARIAFRVSTRIDSQTILDSTGAEKLIGKGDMLYNAGIDSERIQCGYISNDEINAITSFIGDQVGYEKNYNTPYYLPDPDPQGGEGGEGGLIDMKDLDERFEEAARQVVMSQRGSTSDLQRKLGMGYAKAGRVMDQLEAAGIVGPQEGSKPRMVLVPDLAELDKILDAYMHRG